MISSQQEYQPEAEVAPEYRAKEILVRDTHTNEFISTSPHDYQALIAPPAFAAGW
jgi:hypothetical protein